MPVESATEVFVGPRTRTRSTPGRVVKASITSSGRGEVTRMSTSPIVSFLRRIDPARFKRRTEASEASRRSISRATGRIFPRRRRPSAVRLTWMLARMFASVFSPNPGRSRIRPAFAAASRSSTVLTPSSRERAIAFFGPIPGTRVRCCAPSGSSSRRAARYPRSPVSTISWIFSAMARPTPGISSSSPRRATSAIRSGRPSTAIAARRYACGLNRTPLISRRVATS